MPSSETSVFLQMAPPGPSYLQLHFQCKLLPKYRLKYLHELTLVYIRKGESQPLPLRRLLVRLSGVNDFSNRFLDTLHCSGQSENWPLVNHIFPGLHFSVLQRVHTQEEKPPHCAFHIPAVPQNHC